MDQEILSLSGGRTRRTGELGAVDVGGANEGVTTYRMEMTKVKHLLKKQIQRFFCVIRDELRTQEHLFSRFIFESDLAIILKGKKTDQRF